MPNELSQSITLELWDCAISLCQSKPSLARMKSGRVGFFEGVRYSEVLPIHEACAAHAPYNVIEALVAAYPESVKVKESAYSRLPLHIACRKTADIRIISLLLDANKDGCLEADSLGRLPLHYAFSNGASDQVVGQLLQAGPNAARGVDRRGWTPLHVAASVGASAFSIGMLLDLYPEASVLCTEKGSTPRSCLNLHSVAHKEELEALLSQYESKVDDNVRMPEVPFSEYGIV